MTLGERIKFIRGDQSRDIFAPKTGVSKNTLVNYEKGARVPDAEFLNKLLDMYPNINPTWLLTGNGSTEWSEREKDQLDFKQALEKLKYKISHTQTGLGKYLLFTKEEEDSAITREQLRAFLGNNYRPSDNQLRAICRKAGGEFREESFINTIISGGHTPSDKSHKDTVQPLLSISPLEEDCRLIRDIVMMYEINLAKSERKESEEKKAKNIALIYRYFKEHPIEYHDEVDVSIYIDEWF